MIELITYGNEKTGKATWAQWTPEDLAVLANQGTQFFNIRLTSSQSVILDMPNGPTTAEVRALFIRVGLPLEEKNVTPRRTSF